MIEISPGRIWQGSQDDAKRVCKDTNEWERLGIKGVLCSAHNIELTYAWQLPILRVAVDDHTDVPEQWYELAARFHLTYGATFVHCNAGKNRSSAFSACLLIADGLGVDEALAKVNQPTDALVTSLRRWAQGRAA